LNPLSTNQSVKAAFFDVDGVLLDSLPHHLDFCREKAKELGLNVGAPQEKEFRLMVARGAKANPMKEFLRTVGFPEEHIDTIDADYQARFSTRYTSPKFEGVDQMLRVLAHAHVPLGLVTSNVRQNVEHALGETMGYFREDLLFFGATKTDALTNGIEQLGLAPEDCVYVGDVPSDATAALQAGLKFLGVTYGWGILGDEKDFKTVQSSAEILDGLPLAEPIPFPFDAARKTLYSVQELWTGYDPDMRKNFSLDARIFRYHTRSKYSPRLEELRAQRSHDAGIEDAIDELLGVDDRSFPTLLQPVMILGSHSKYRRDVWFTRVAHLTYELAKAGFFVATGGGPGLMEAGNLGAYMAKNYSKAELNAALDLLRESQEPSPKDKRKQYEMPDYWEVAQRVARKFPDGGQSLGVPTWFYGHEGANRFASHVAKFLSNGLRESKMTSIGVHGAIFAPGGPGTAQEVFTDAAENTYYSFQWMSPMVFFNEPDDEITGRMMDILRKQTSADYLSQDMYLHTTDTQRIVRFLVDRPPQFRKR
jgi:phosphoglycolate phosphatase-like HAD superfamily hydrolase/predicted Rossmann-fold nucleotide-binding protein